MQVREFFKSRIIMLSIAFMAVATYYLLPRRAVEPLPEDGLVRVTVIEVKPSAYHDEVSAVGTTQAIQSVTLSPSVTETVTKVRFKDRQEVEAGDVIVYLSSDEESAQLEAALITLKEREAQYERSQQLFQKKFVSEAKLNQDKSALKEAAGMVNQLKAKLADRLITAPFSGVLGLGDISPGKLLMPGQPIITLDQLDQMKVDFYLPERYLSFMKNIASVEAMSDAYPHHVFQGKIVAVDTHVDLKTRMFKVRMMIDNSDRRLTPGMFMRLRLRGKERSALFIPDTAVLSKGYEKFVYRCRASRRLEEISIEIGQRTTDKVEVISGLKVGDLIVKEGLRKLRPGQHVQIIETGQPE